MGPSCNHYKATGLLTLNFPLTGDLQYTEWQMHTTRAGLNFELHAFWQPQARCMADAYNKGWFELCTLYFALASNLQHAAQQMHTTKAHLFWIYRMQIHSNSKASFNFDL